MDFITRQGVVIDGKNESLTFMEDKFTKVRIAKIEIGPVMGEKPEPTFQLSHLPRNVTKDFREMFKKISNTFEKSMLELGYTSTHRSLTTESK